MTRPTRLHRRRRSRLAVLAIPVLALLAAACGGGDSDSSSGGGAGPASAAEQGSGTESTTLRLGFFPNITHATALVGVERGIFAEKLGPGTRLETQGFNAGPAAIEALFAGAIDATYIGPNPAINGYVKSRGEALRVVSGATSGGAFLVVRPGIGSSADLRGKKLATPQLGGTQDVALRSWLQAEGLRTDTSGGGDVSIVPQENAQTLDTFKTGAIDGAWVPEPWATRLIQEGGAEVLVDERDLWPAGQYVTTHLIVAKEFLDEHPATVRRLLEGQVAANDFVNQQPAEAQKAANDRIEELTGKRVNDQVIAGSWANLTFTNDPVASSLAASAEAAESIDLLDLGKVDLAGIYDLSLLNDVLAAAGQPAVGQL
jgi:NitT/TauT family transport system substrate-binding protein